MSELIIVVAVLALVAIIIGAVKDWHNKLPRWTKVKFFIIDQTSMGMSFTAVEEGLMEKFGLTPQQAKLCVNNAQDDDWLRMQTFLEDDPSV